MRRSGGLADDGKRSEVILDHERSGTLWFGARAILKWWEVWREGAPGCDAREGWRMTGSAGRADRFSVVGHTIGRGEGSGEGKGLHCGLRGTRRIYVGGSGGFQEGSKKGSIFRLVLKGFSYSGSPSRDPQTPSRDPQKHHQNTPCNGLQKNLEK